MTTTGGVAGTFDDVTGGSAVLRFTLDYPTANQVDLVVARNSYGFLGGTRNQRAVGGALDRVFPDADGDLRDVLDQLDRMDLAQLRETMDQIGGAQLDGATGAALKRTGAMLETLSGRFNRPGGSSPGAGIVSMRFDPDAQIAATLNNAETLGLVAANEPPSAPLDKRWSLWARNFNTWFGERNSEDTVGYDAYTAGVLVGNEYRYTPEISFGAAMGYSRTKLNWTQGAGDAEIDALHTALYGSWRPGNFHANAAVGFGFDWFETTRKIRNLNRAAKGKHTGQEVFAHLGGGYDWRACGFVFGPTASLQYVLLREQGYTESGAEAMNLRINSRTSHSLRSRLGLRLIRPFAFAWGTLEPEFRAGWIHEFRNGARTQGAAFNGAAGGSFST